MATHDTPTTGAAAGGASQLGRLNDLDEFKVADGYPEYHVRGCGELHGLDAEAVPHTQAVEDGFQPCVVCDPDAVVAGRRVVAAQHPVAQLGEARGDEVDRRGGDDEDAEDAQEDQQRHDDDRRRRQQHSPRGSLTRPPPPPQNPNLVHRRLT